MGSGALEELWKNFEASSGSSHIPPSARPTSCRTEHAIPHRVITIGTGTALRKFQACHATMEAHKHVLYYSGSLCGIDFKI